MALEGEVLGALHHGVEDPSSIWRTTVGEVVAMRDELVLLVQVRIIGLAHFTLVILLPYAGETCRLCRHRPAAGRNDFNSGAFSAAVRFTAGETSGVVERNVCVVCVVCVVGLPIRSRSLQALRIEPHILRIGRVILFHHA